MDKKKPVIPSSQHNLHRNCCGTNPADVGLAMAKPLAVITANIPTEMRLYNQWVLWKQELVKGELTKVPYQLTGAKALSSQPKTWSTFNDIVAAYNSGGFDGIGFVLTKSDPFIFVDFDKCLNEDWALEKIKVLDSYTEISPSGDGYHVITEAKKPDGMGCKSKEFHNSKLEVYDSGRYATFTGHRLEQYPTEPQKRQAQLESTCAHLLKNASTPTPKQPTSQPKATASKSDNELLDIMFKICRGSQNLFNGIGSDDASANDLALCNHLAFITGKNAVAMDRLFRQSALMRPKWDERRGADTYGNMTLGKAIESTQNIYTGRVSGANYAPMPKAGVSFFDETPMYEGASAESVEINSKQAEPMQDVASPFLDLAHFSLRGQSEAMKAKMLDDVFILGRMALLGQSTVFYAKPNAGKTLITISLIIEAIKKGNLNGDDVFYINADDNHKGLTHKLQLAEDHGFHMLAPGYKGFDASLLSPMLKQLIQQDTARGKVLILDTVKKFTDIMDKKKGSEFGESVRQFVAHGGSVIMLAHVNKHRDEEKKVIYSGTSDLVDDADCAYTLDTVTEDALSKERTVKFEMFKNRGDVVLEEVYRYDASASTSYTTRLKSVVVVSDDERKQAEENQIISDRIDRNREAIDAIKETIQEGITKKTELIASAVERSGLSKRKVAKALADHTGSNIVKAHYWHLNVEDKNAHVYQLNWGA